MSNQTSDESKPRQSRAALRDQRDAPKPMRRMTHMNESKLQHVGFLLWAVQDKSGRKMAAITRLIKRSHSTVRQWSSRYRWSDRIQSVQDSELWAARMVNWLYPGYVMPALAEMNHAYELEKIATDPTKTSDDQSQEALEHINEGLLQPSEQYDRDVAEWLQIIRGIMKKAKKNIKDDRIDVKISDIPQLVRTWMLITGGPTERTEHVDASMMVQESVRVQQARQNGGETLQLLQAMQEDLEEGMVIIQQLISAEEGAKLLEFPGYEYPEEEEEAG